MLSPAASWGSLHSDGGHGSSSASSLRVAVHAGGREGLPADWEIDAVLDARSKQAWPVLTQLEADLRRLPVLYELDVDSAEWLARPGPLPRRRRRIVAIGKEEGGTAG